MTRRRCYINMETTIEQLTARIEAEPNNAALWYQRGRLYWQQDKRGAAMSDYAHAAELDPNSPAAAALEQARQIMAFYCTDLYNP